MRRFYKYLFLLISAGGLMCRTSAQVERPKLIAAYINYVARNTHWPQDFNPDTFRLAVFTDQAAMKNEFKAFATGRTIQNKPVKVFFITSPEMATDPNIVLLLKDQLRHFAHVSQSVEGKAVLLVSEEYHNKNEIMINIYKTRENQMLFEVNHANILLQGLRLEPELLLAGGNIIDVEGLYRESQQNLTELQKRMQVTFDSLKVLNKYIQFSREQINEQQAEIENQKDLIAYRTHLIDSHQKIIAMQKGLMSMQQDSVNKKNEILKAQAGESERIEEVLKSRQSSIDILNREIEDKNILVYRQSEKISRQKQIMLLFLVAVFLSITLLFTIFMAYRSNKLKKEALGLQKQEIEENLAELKNLNIQLQKADQYKSIFLASMSHELRTPLNSIIGYTGILLMGMTGALNEEQNKQLGKVKNNAKHLLNLINDILDISKIEADKVELNCENFNFNKLTDEVVEIILPKADEKKLSLSVDIPENIVICSDSRRVKQVLLNLVSNAVNYTHEGSITIQAGQIPGDKIRIVVSDTGIGIPEEEIARLFQPFQQINSTLTKDNKGTGLGLYLCKKILNLLKGEIYVKSGPGQGSSFFVELPVQINHA